METKKHIRSALFFFSDYHIGCLLIKYEGCLFELLAVVSELVVVIRSGLTRLIFLPNLFFWQVFFFGFLAVCF
jgi:hypothetical protein